MSVCILSLWRLESCVAKFDSSCHDGEHRGNIWQSQIIGITVRANMTYTCARRLIIVAIRPPQRQWIKPLHGALEGNDVRTRQIRSESELEAGSLR